jgi:hypothetical protein
MAEELQWMDHVRWTYIHRVGLMARQHGLTLAQSPIDPAEEPLDIWDESGKAADEDCLYLLIDQATGERYPRRGITLGEIEDYLLAGLRGKVPMV